MRIAALPLLLAALTFILTGCPATVPTGQPTPGAPSVTGDANKGRQLFESKACISCHVLSGIPSATGTIGPPLDRLATTAETRKPGMGAAAYIRESIKEPNAYVVPGYPSPTLMILPNPVSDSEINDLVAFLMTQK